MNDANNTALVLKNITRDEFGSTDQGFYAETFDRVEILKKGTWSNGTRWYEVRTDAGEVFHTTDHEVLEEVAPGVPMS